MNPNSNIHLVKDAILHFEYVTKNIASHANVLDEKIYPQPSTYLTTHFVCMRVAGFDTVDFDTLTAVSGASALFGYEPGEFMPKYAHLNIGISKRIERATGFGWERFQPRTPEECYQFIKEGVDSNRPVTSTFFEDILFSGYEENKGEPKVHVMTDGADYFIRWFGWKEFKRWFREWGDSGLGRHTERKKCLPEKDVAIRVISDLVDWSTAPPENVVREYPGATFGLAGIEKYADDCENIKKFPDWRACHDINPQWITRNSTAIYLANTAERGIFDHEVNESLQRSSALFKDAYDHWREFYRLLGHVAPKKNGRNREIRARGADTVRKALNAEKEALVELTSVSEKINMRSSDSR
jgi:hypothetical protein